jgi:hypothetical protein
MVQKKFMTLQLPTLTVSLSAVDGVVAFAPNIDLMEHTLSSELPGWHVASA